MKVAQGEYADQKGVTLVELIMAIVIIGVALSGAIRVMIYTTAHSGDSVVDQQGLAIAEAYLEEILLKAFDDPGGGAESGRDDYDDVGDYHGLSDVGAKDQEGNAITGLENYTVAVTVVDTALGSVPANDSKKVTVTVSHPTGINLTLVGYRTDY